MTLCALKGFSDGECC